MKNEIIEKYKEIGVFNISLQDECKFCSKCWDKIEDRKWSKDNLEPFDEGEKPINIYSPWIGENYDRLRILALGINMNHYGGIDAVSYLVGGAKVQIGQGRRKIDFGSKDYSGTFYYHRLPAYAAIFLEVKGIIDEKRINNYPDKNDVNLAFDFVAITNSIKCSPRGGKSEPTFEMWNNCNRYILKEEVSVLKPKEILILGKTTNYDYFKSAVVDELFEEKIYNHIKVGRARLNDNEFNFYGIPHPTSFGGNSWKIFEELNKIIKKTDANK